MTSVPEFVTSVTQAASFWSSWPEQKKSQVIPVLHSNCFRNFGRVLHFLALEKADLSSCKLRDIKCVVLPVANKSVGVGTCIRVQGLIGRGFGWNGKVALPISEMQTNTEESSTTLKRHNATFETFKCDELVPLGEVSIVAMSPQELQECLTYTTATLHSMPVLRDGFDSHEVDSASLLSFWFKEPTNNYMCVLH
jgi:hypothetical protein